MTGSYHHSMLVPQPLSGMQVAAGTAAAPSVNFANDADTGVFSPAANTLALSTGGSERVRVDSSGRVGIGCSPSVPLEIRQAAPQIRLYDGSVVDARWYTVSGSGATIFGNLSGHALAFYTANAEFMRGQPDGKVGIGTVFPSARLHVNGSGPALWAVTSDSASPALRGYATHASYASQTLLLDADRPAASGFAFLLARSGVASSPDTKFKLLGDGNAYADGAWTGGGADYAEFFEWVDGNPDGEDRRGLTVVLEGERIRPATDADAPERIVGVVSATPTVIGDAAWNHWSGKYLRDEYGGLITEEYEVVSWEDEEPSELGGEPVRHQRSFPGDAVPEGVVVPADVHREIQHRPILDPAFDPNRPYVPRAGRREWAAIGLMGKLRIRHGQPIGDRWVKLRSHAPLIDEWLVR
ncbi:peptidase G2 autoproteolytic cleavage domain-containing protein [Azospirillum sp. TSA6c]|uniref:peptidase G2 autoproteolytic cleavage domain-containing protein n=1 Tax=unclassified Azospirillum TaxID=2630922 RepID=UPI000D61B449|nr:peptidase G2 autoproteolytic cleavage domain-containing protein [Azospirillum sp. TSA6c]PWC53851.1 hypothetical protein TSA6c_01560 [Azospirillum sp. TSA6c]